MHTARTLTSRHPISRRLPDCLSRSMSIDSMRVDPYPLLCKIHDRGLVLISARIDPVLCVSG